MAATRYVMSAVRYVLFTQPSPASWGDVINEDTLFQLNIHSCPGTLNTLKIFLLKLNHVFLALSPVCLKIFLISFLRAQTTLSAKKPANVMRQRAGAKLLLRPNNTHTHHSASVEEKLDYDMDMEIN